MLLYGYTVVFEEETMVPYVLPYIIKMGYDKFVIYDDGCLDHTLELLSDGLTKAGIDFEIRTTVGKGVTQYDFDGRKRDSQAAAFNECQKIARETGESVWMTFTDFDEVIYCSRERQDYVKEYLEAMDARGYNFCSPRMLHLTWDGKEKDDELLPHQWNGVRGTWWLYESMKVTMIKVNDVANAIFYCGNHNIGIRMVSGKEPKEISQFGEFHGFHLKYFDSDAFSKKIFRHYDRDPKSFLKEIKCCSFPMEMYFLMKGFSATKATPNPREMGEGLFLF